jgi:hypothetical protein
MITDYDRALAAEMVAILVRRRSGDRKHVYCCGPADDVLIDGTMNLEWLVAAARRNLRKREVEQARERLAAVPMTKAEAAALAGK